MENKKGAFSKEVSNGIKGVAIIMMMFHHCFLSPERWKGQVVSFFPFSQDFVVAVSKSFKICVALFVFITAYGITKSVSRVLKIEDKRLKREFYCNNTMKRLFKLIWRFLPCFAFWEIFSVLNQIFHFVKSKHSYGTVYGSGVKSFVYFIIDGLGLANAFETPTFNGTWWYMSLAITIVLIMPLLFALYQRFGIITVVIAPILPRILGIRDNNLTRYLFLIMIGIMCADKNLPEKLYNFKICKNNFINKLIKFIVSAVLVLVLYRVRMYNGKLVNDYIEIVDAVVPLAVIWFCHEFLLQVPVLKQILVFIGKYSMTLFLTHTFFREYYFKSFIYSPKNFILIALLLLGVSLLYSFLFDNFLKIIGYNKLSDKLFNHFEAKLKNL